MVTCNFVTVQQLHGNFVIDKGYSPSIHGYITELFENPTVEPLYYRHFGTQNFWLLFAFIFLLQRIYYMVIDHVMFSWVMDSC